VVTQSELGHTPPPPLEFSPRPPSEPALTLHPSPFGLTWFPFRFLEAFYVLRALFPVSLFDVFFCCRRPFFPLCKIPFFSVARFGLSGPSVRPVNAFFFWEFKNILLFPPPAPSSKLPKLTVEMLHQHACALRFHRDDDFFSCL